MTTYTLTMEIDVFDEEALMAVAREHAAQTGRDEGLEIAVEDASDALIVLLDPGGGDAYAGNLNDAGISIIETTCERSPSL